MKRALVAAGAVLPLLVVLSACGADSPSGNDLDSGRPDASESAAEATVSAHANLGGMSYQADQLAQSLPQFGALTEAPTDGTEVTETPSDTASESASASTGPLDACSVVTAELIQRDLGLDITTPATSDTSSFGDPDATDCYYADANGILVVEATTNASTDLSAQNLGDVLSLPGAAAIEGADRGFAYVPDQTATSGAAAVTVVVGERGLQIATTAAQPITLDQAVQFGTDLVAALQ